MEEGKKSVDGVLENLALITDALQTLFEDGKMICVFELNDDDFKKVQSNFRKIDNQHKKFSINISGVEHVFIHEELANQKYENIVEEPKVKSKKTIIQKLLSWFKSR